MIVLLRDEQELNEYISAWDTSKVKNMSGMFEGAAAFNQPIGGWDVSKGGHVADVLSCCSIQSAYRWSGCLKCVNEGHVR